MSLFSYGDPPWVQVTQGRVIIRENTYALANISSVTRETKKQDDAAENFLVAFLMIGIVPAVTIPIMFIQGYEFDAPAPMIAVAVAGASSCYLGYWLTKNAKKKPLIHSVYLQTNSGRVQALQTTDADLADGLVGAISRVLDGGKATAEAPRATGGGGFCSTCGASLAPGAKFCANCGAAVGG